MQCTHFKLLYNNIVLLWLRYITRYGYGQVYMHRYLSNKNIILSEKINILKYQSALKHKSSEVRERTCRVHAVEI